MLSFTTETVELIKLLSRKYTSKFNSIDFKDLKSINSHFALKTNFFHYALTGEKLEEDSGVFAVKAANGALERVYAPVVSMPKAKAEGDLTLSFGGKQIPLTLERKKDKINTRGLFVSPIENIEIVGSFVTEKTPSGYEGTQFKFEIANTAEGKEDQFIVVICDIRYNDELIKDTERLKELKAGEVDTAFKRKFSDLSNYLGLPIEFDNFDGDLVAINDLEVGDYEVVAYKVFPIESQGRTASILTLRGAREGSEETGDLKLLQKYHIRDKESKDNEILETKELDLVQAWGIKTITTVLQNSPELDPDNPFTLIVASTNGGKKKKSAVASIIVPAADVDTVEEEDLEFEFNEFG